MKKLGLIILVIGISLTIYILLRPQQTTAEGYDHIYPGKAPYALQITPDYSTIVAATNDGIALIDKASMLIIQEYNFPHIFHGLALNPFDGYFYFTYMSGGNGSGSVGRIRLSDGLTETLSLSPANVANCTLDESGDYLYVCGGTWPPVEGGFNTFEFNHHVGTGMIFEVRTSDFTITRSVNVGVGNIGISCKQGKLFFMSPEDRDRVSSITGRIITVETCHIMDINSFQLDFSFPGGYGYYNTSIPIPDDDYVIAAFNHTTDDGVGFGLVNVMTGEIEHWYVVDPNWNNENFFREGGGYTMTVDEENNILYSTLFAVKNLGQTNSRLGIINLNTNEYSDWVVEPFRLYRHILYDPDSGNVFLTVPDDDAIVVLDPPEYQPPPLVPPIACFTYNPVSGPSPLLVTIDNCSYDEDGEIVRIDCDWDADGEIDEVMEGNPDVLLHTFTEPGTNDFVLTVVDNDELEADWTGSVDVV